MKFKNRNKSTPSEKNSLTRDALHYEYKINYAGVG